MSMRNFLNLYRLGVYANGSTVLKCNKSLHLQKKFIRHIHKTGALAGAATVVNQQVQQHVSITKTFPTRHQSLKIAFDDNLASDFQYIWLRDNCQCMKCIHPVSKQKVLDTVNLDINIKPKCVKITETGQLEIKWPENDDDHISLYGAEWLHKYGKGFQLDTRDSVNDTLPTIEIWNKEKIENIMPQIGYKEVMETDEGVKKWLDMMYKYGLVIMKDVPCLKGEVINVIERVSYVKKTKWGSSFDVLCEPVQTDPNHLAYTGMYLEHHTDMNYLEKSPGLQALHCLKANPTTDGEDIGGQSFFVDGYYIAKWLQNEHPSSFQTLTHTPVVFSIQSHNMEYCNEQYVLCATKTGTIQEVHYNTRTMAPLQGPASSVQPFYEAYKLMGQKMREKESEFAFNLVPGDLVAFNNRRILHGRTSFNPRKMFRHLEGCYGDMDEVITRYRALYKNEK